MFKTIDRSVLTKMAQSVLDNTPGLYLQSCTNKLNQEPFAEDCRFFAANPHRRYCIRPAYHGEFDSIEAVTEYLQVPQQFALVSQVCPGKHKIDLVYYGRKYANVRLVTDADVWELLQRMRADGGCDVVEVGAFLKQLEQNSKLANSNTKVN